MAISQTYLAQQQQGRGGPSGLADVLEVLLDKGLVIDAFVRVSLVGIELLTIDARIVIASVDTYLRFAEAVNRLDLLQVNNAQTLGDLVSGKSGGSSKDSSESKTRGALEGAADKGRELIGREDSDNEDDDQETTNDDDGDRDDDKSLVDKIKDRGKVFS
jgi:gas vesicle structural protein